MDSVKVYSPGSIGNVGCGFDVFGLAIEAVGDIVEVTRNNTGQLSISEISGDSSITQNPEKNIVTVGAKALLERVANKDGYDFKITKGVAAGSGMGSSGSSATAGVFAINELLDRPYTKHELLEFAAVGEQVASHQIHYDNIGPSMLGGLNIVSSMDPLEILEVDVPDNLYLAMVRPDVVIKTEEAKKLVKNTVPLSTVIRQFGHISGFLVGMMSKNIDLIGRSVEDLIATPYRSQLIPNFDIAKEEAIKAGASGFNISGSGPAMFAICDGEEKASTVLTSLKKVYSADSKAQFYLTKTDKEGTRVIR